MSPFPTRSPLSLVATSPAKNTTLPDLIPMENGAVGLARFDDVSTFLVIDFSSFFDSRSGESSAAIERDDAAGCESEHARRGKHGVGHLLRRCQTPHRR